MKKLGVLALLSLVAGCSAAIDAEPETEVDDAALSAAGTALIGAYTSAEGPIRGLILTPNKVGSSNEFIADVDTGVRCVTAPCDSSERVTGTFKATYNTITLRARDASARSASLFTMYQYRRDGSRLVLARTGRVQHLSKAESYCAIANDCAAQGLVPPRCALEESGYTCVENRCSYACGSREPAPLPALECPNTTFVNCMPPTNDPDCSPIRRAWVEENCPAVSYLD